MNARGNWISLPRLTLILMGLVMMTGTTMSRRAYANEPTSSVGTAVKEGTEAPLVQVSDLRDVEGDASLPSFIPRPGRFELKVTRLWHGRIQTKVTGDDEWTIKHCQHIGSSSNSENELRSSGGESVLNSATSAGDWVNLYAVQNGTATVHYKGAVKGSNTPVKCELRIVVEPDTSEIDNAIKEALPTSRIRVKEIRGGSALIIGEVPAGEDVTTILEIARLFYPDVVNMLKVTAPFEVVTESKRDSGDNATLGDKKQRRTVQDPVADSQRLAVEQLREIKQLRADVGSLRDEVRQLRELVEKKQSALVQPEAEELETKQSAVPANAEEQQPISQGKTKAGSTQALFFTAKWCGPCQQMGPAIAKLQREGFPIQVIDIDANATLARQYHVQSLPCLVLIKNDREIARHMGVSQEDSLRNLFKNLSVTSTAKEFEKTAEDTQLIATVYPVTDLMIPLDGSPAKKPTIAEWLKLIDQITTTIEPSTWEVNGGPSSIMSNDTNGFSLVIRTLPKTHESITGLLEALRKQYEVQISLKTWLPQFADQSLFDEAGLNIEFDHFTKSARLSEQQATQLLRHLGAGVRMGTSITMFNGQVAHVACHVPDQPNLSPDLVAEFRLNVRATSVEEGRLICINAAVNPRNLVNGIVAARSQLIPDGGYVLFDVTEQIQHGSLTASNGSRILTLVQASVIDRSMEESETLLK